MTVVLKGVSFLIIAFTTIHCIYVHWKTHRLPMIRCFAKSSLISNRWSSLNQKGFVLFCFVHTLLGSFGLNSYRLNQR